MVAGEASSDLLASHLIKALQRHLPDAEFFGIGGPMQAVGFKALWPAEARRAWLRRRLKTTASCRASAAACSTAQEDPRPPSSASMRPTSACGSRRRLQDRGIPAIHFVSPSIWAWRRGVEGHRPLGEPHAVPVPLRARALPGGRRAGELRGASAGRCLPSRPTGGDARNAADLPGRPGVRLPAGQPAVRVRNLADTYRHRRAAP